MSNSKCVYYKEKEQKSIDGGITWVDTGNFRKGGLISTQASQCGSFVTEYRWTKADYVCDNANKYKGYKQQVSYDNGGSWVDTGVVDIGALIESNSKDCGYDEQWFVMTGDNNFICDGASKYKKKEMKYTRDSGTTWNSFDPPKYEKGDLIAQTSTDCVSMKVTYVDGTTNEFNGLTIINENTVSDKVNVKEVEIYDGVRCIGDGAFQNCTNLTCVTIPNSVTSIGDIAFSYCTNLTGVTIPNSVTTIGNGAFSLCTSLTDVTIPNSVTSIGNSAFYVCRSLTGVTIPDSVTSIGEYTFVQCTGLTSIIIPDSVTSIGSYAFNGCSNLRTMTVEATTPPSLGNGAIPSNIQRIYVPADSLDKYKSADGWSYYADKIWAIGTTLSMKVTYKDGSTKIFTGLTNIESDTDSNKKNAKEVVIYDGVTSIGEQSFYKAISLTDVTLPDTITNIGEEAFDSCYSLTGVTLPDTLISIGDGAFELCAKLTDITIPYGVKTIGKNAFFNCIGLTSVVIPNSVTEIGDYAFYYCSNLTNVTIGYNVKSIGDEAFFECKILSIMKIKATTPPALGDNAISTTISTIYVPASSVDAYKSADGWSNYASKIQAIPQ